jgi:hypothetical protein
MATRKDYTVGEEVTQATFHEWLNMDSKEISF